MGSRRGWQGRRKKERKKDCFRKLKDTTADKEDKLLAPKRTNYRKKRVSQMREERTKSVT